MKICIVATNGPGTVGGLASYLRGLATALAASEPIDVIARFNSRATDGLSWTHRERACEHLDEATITHVVSPRAAYLPALAAVRRLMFYGRTQGLAVSLFDLAYGPSLSSALPTDIDLIHVIGTGWELLGPAVTRIARRNAIPVTALPAMHPGTWGDSSFDGRFYRNVDAVFALSTSERDRLIDLGVAPDHVHICGLAPSPAPQGDSARFRARHQLGTRPIVLYVGRKQRYKGYHRLLDAVPLIQRSVPDVCVVAAGPSTEPPYPQVGANSLIDLDVCSDADKADALAACDVFCMPSEAESFGITYVEAWAYGKPVVGGPAPAVQELLRHGEDGLCVDREPETVAAAVVRLLTDSGLREELGRRGHHRQQASFTWEAVAQAHNRVFASALERIGRDRPTTAGTSPPLSDYASA